ncbi:MAG TPA: heme-binding protein, partial [Gammaproteobacteria bacterium]|nr:heme-binding protein [Gammaproteobacteria bacterium]
TSPATIDMARGKAYTALVFRSSTLDFQKATASDPVRAPQRNVPGILALGGGVPISAGGEIIGGVASSGSNQTTDDECARAGLAKAAELLK